MNMVRVLEEETAKGIDTLAAKTRKVAEQASRLPGGQAQELAAMTEPEEYMVSRPLSELEHRAAQWMLEEFKARNQVAYERYDSLTKQEQGIIDRWQALEYRLNPPAAPVSGRQNSKLFSGNAPYGIIDTRQAVGYDKGKESGGNELSPVRSDWAQPNQTKPGTPNAYAEYLAYKQKVQAQQQRLALEQALQELLVQEQTARAVAGPQAFAYNGADGFTSGGYETGGTTGSGGTGGSGGIDGAYEAGSLFEPSSLDGGVGVVEAFSADNTSAIVGQAPNDTNEYRTPKGGGGVTDRIKVGDQEVSFGHGGRHLEGTGVSAAEVNQAIANDIIVKNLEIGQFYKGHVDVDGVTIEYTSYKLKDRLINIGTYYLVQ